jgi:hypothetical protein
MQNKRNLLYATIAFLLMTSCNNSNQQNSKAGSSSDSTNTSTSTDQPGSTSTGAEKATINVTITGGDMAGSYSAVCKEGCCSWGIAGDNVFGNQYSETGKGPKELSSVQLIVDKVTGNTNTKQFTLTVSFGELFSNKGKSFNIDTREGRNKGSGTLDLQYSGDKAVVAIKGVSSEGPSIDLKMECNKVMTTKNIGQ